MSVAEEVDCQLIHREFLVMFHALGIRGRYLIEYSTANLAGSSMCVKQVFRTEFAEDKPHVKCGL